MKILVDRGRCTGIGICESVAPHVFEVGDDGALVLLKEHVDDAERALLQEAVDSCPAVALALADDD